jgi:hypothetical protein
MSSSSSTVSSSTMLLRQRTYEKTVNQVRRQARFLSVSRLHPPHPQSSQVC